MRRHYINPGALIEAVISLLFGLKLFWMAYTGQYLLFVTPRMKGYLYFAALVMAVWAFSCFARTGIPEYRQHLNRTLVLLIPLMRCSCHIRRWGHRGICPIPARDWYRRGVREKKADRMRRRISRLCLARVKRQ